MRASPSTRHAGGFTLIELLVAISVLAIVAVLGWRGLDTIVRARVGLTSELTQTRGLQLAFAQMQTDCLNVADESLIGTRQPLQASSGRLTLIRTTFAENQPSRLQVVAYRLRDGVLSRRESPATRDLGELDTFWSNMLGDSDSIEPVVLESDIDEMAIRSWVPDGNGWRQGANPTTASTLVPGSSQNAGSNTGTTGTTGTTNGTGTTNTAGTNANAAAAVAQNQQNTLLTGLEVSLRPRSSGANLVKIFLLGAV
ncbi:type II secretion system protein J (GspJ) [Noviherbaspirillum humi]|uniref:Type II secretion system protein J (GspJ) n=1 Tax=Noviherbaspirillum humi TaxID=1688639 RepID=A0A239CG69_9BURK|nr:prepilin-type N-terminal cleavage/methylation domain-containing protein [Noviherbaspirillum humi]SNS18333.1 type II secretion system protein J (GspJ) [Noviherbaspirillum humi]